MTMSLWGINGSRVNVASCWLGASQMSIDLAIEHFKSDSQRAKPTSDVLSDEWELAAMASKLYASRLLVREAAGHIQVPFFLVHF
ncbi:unnamed protein product [Gongylonema pulchrum]|uniref:Acyl-CoA dehydrogenase/oxidase C-terminal domain-containing protein n=1 Tax=Gongylonema pulchrum TaxID=637853 RepID=A0A3P6QDA5_9BILA|nr:unnamed protein product [Gongylonema pulchrum]